MPALDLDTDADLIAERVSDHDTLFVACLCAQWCGTCRDYRATFDRIAEAHPEICFAYIDIETHADRFDDLDVENFPTLLIQRHDSVLFFGPMLPHHEILQRTVESFHAQSPDESRRYAGSDPERRNWQTERNLRQALAARPTQ